MLAKRRMTENAIRCTFHLFNTTASLTIALALALTLSSFDIQQLLACSFNTYQ